MDKILVCLERENVKHHFATLIAWNAEITMFLWNVLENVPPQTFFLIELHVAMIAGKILDEEMLFVNVLL